MSNIKSRYPIYATLLKLYPATYRKRYEQEILQTTTDMLEEAPDRLARVSVWAHIAFDLSLNIMRQQASYTGSVLANETPRYLKRSSVLAATLLLPFIAVIMANVLSKATTGQDLYRSWLWSFTALSIWVLYLPEAALLVVLASYALFIIREGSSAPHSWLRRAVDIRLLWPIVLPAVLAFGIISLVVLHDSVRCWVQNPTYAVTHVDQAWQCTVKNQSLKGFKYP
jgi:hypothetical protein